MAPAQVPADTSCSESLINLDLAMRGCAVLALGGGVYAVARPAEIALMPAALVVPGVELSPTLVLIAGSAPSFLHSLAMSLLSASVSSPTRRAQRGACVLWAALGVAFELWQGVGAQLARTSVLWPTRLSIGYFDRWDVAAVLLGALSACVLLHAHRTDTSRERS